MTRFVIAMVVVLGGFGIHRPVIIAQTMLRENMRMTRATLRENSTDRNSIAGTVTKTRQQVSVLFVIFTQMEYSYLLYCTVTNISGGRHMLLGTTLAPAILRLATVA